MRQILLAGADKVSINSAAVQRPELIAEGAARFGNQCIVLAVDARRNQEGWWEVVIAGGRTPTGMDAVEWIQKGVELGVDYSMTVSCYQPDAQGGACGRCDACRLRRVGFEAAGVPDRTRYAQP